MKMNAEIAEGEVIAQEVLCRLRHLSRGKAPSNHMLAKKGAPRPEQACSAQPVQR